MVKTIRKAASPETQIDFGAVGPGLTEEIAPIGELGSLLVLTYLLAAPLPGNCAVETLHRAARGIGWQPVGDVLCCAIERCLARDHVRFDIDHDLHLTKPGRLWLIAMMSRRFPGLPAIGGEVMLACQLITAAQLNDGDRQEILKAVASDRRDQLRQQRACDRACPAVLRPWQDWTRARVINDLRRLDGLSLTGMSAANAAID
jgi:hypothetical protein